MGSILVLIGSPRRNGNTALLAEAFARGAGGGVELLRVTDYSIRPCLGCNACYNSEGHACAQKDDMALICQKLMRADTLIVASPVYFYGVSAQLKTLIDRLHTPMRNEFRIKRLGLILAGAASLPDLFDPIVMQYRMICRFFGLEDIGMVLVRGVKDAGDVLAGDGLQRAYGLGVSAALKERRQERTTRGSADTGEDGKAGSGMRFRKADAGDAETVMALFRAVTGTPFCTWDESYPGETEIRGDLAAGTLYVLEKDQEIVGSVSVVPENEMDGLSCWTVRDNAREFARVVIRPDHQRKGLSECLVQGVIPELRKLGAASIHIAVAKENIPARKLYRKMGFTFCGEADMYGHSFFLCEKIIGADPAKEEKNDDPICG